MTRPDLTTSFLGLELSSPLVASASPVTGDLDVLERLESAGAGAVVMPSLFEEQIEHEQLALARLTEFGAETFAEALDYFPGLDSYNTGPEEYLRHIEAAKRRLSIPVVASLNGSSRGGWVHYAERMAEAGADALELNVYFVPTDPRVSGSDVEERYVDLVRAVRASVDLPLAVKVAPGFSSPAHLCLRLLEAGADGLVLFNRYLRPDLDLEELALIPHLSLSTQRELHLALLWVGILREHTQATLVASGGVADAADALKLLMVGADVVTTTSALLRRGPEHLGVIAEGLARWMEEREYRSVEQLKGSMSRANCPDPSAYERANYMKTLLSWSGDPI